MAITAILSMILLPAIAESLHLTHVVAVVGNQNRILHTRKV